MLCSVARRRGGSRTLDLRARTVTEWSKTLVTGLRNFDTATTSVSSSPKSPSTRLITIAVVTSAVVATASSAVGVAVEA